MTPTVDIQIDKYILLDLLRQDEIVTIYRAQRQTDQAMVRLEVIAPLFASDEFFARRFKQITQQLAHLEHPNIVRTYEAEQHNGYLYQLQDFVAGRPLAQVLAEEGPFSPARMQQVARQLASALDYAHQKSVTHGNLSAEGVLLGPDDQVYVTDFGQTQALFGVNLMKQGYTTSAPETMAPERVQGQGPSRHADLYALGVLCYQMLTGKPPFSGSPAAILHAHAYKQPKLLHHVNPGIPVAISEIVARMMSKGLELRYNTGAEFARALAVAVNLPKGFATSGLLPKNNPDGRMGHIFSLTVGLVMVAAGLILTGYWLGLNQRPILAQSPVKVTVATTTEVSQAGSVTILPPADSTAAPQPVRPGYGSASDSLLLTPIQELNLWPSAPPLKVITVIITPTSSPTSAPPTRAPATQPAALSSAPEPVIPVGKGLLVFSNPTGYDLVIDLTGPTPESEVIPPWGRQQFVLSPGRYQLMIHTPTGQGLASRTLEFYLPEGQVTEKDYYTDYDVTMR